MADKRQVKKNIKRLQRIKTWQLVILLILALLVMATFLRLNNIGMVERRTAVKNADAANDSTSLLNNLYALQRYSSEHMNASSGTIYLESSYKRDVQKLVDEQKQNGTVKNKNALEKADQVCRSQFPGYSQAYVQCNLSEQDKYSSQSELQTKINFPNPELYRHEFISPRWSPDFAGWSVLVCVLITGVIVLRIISLLILRALLRRHYSSI